MHEQELNDLAGSINSNVITMRGHNKVANTLIMDPAIQILLASVTAVLNNQKHLADMLLLLGTPEE